MIDASAGVRSAAEKAVEDAYQSLATYAKSEKANPKAVAVRKRMLDLVSEGWNAQEALIEELQMQVEILSKRIQLERTPKKITYEKQVSWLDMVAFFAQQWNAKPFDPRAEITRAKHLEMVQNKWADHF